MSRQQIYLLALSGVLIGLSACASAPKPAAPETPDLASILNSAANAETSVVAVTAPAPCCKKQTLPAFLGINGAAVGICQLVDRVKNQLGMAFPGLEAKPLLLAITDPANLAEDAPPAVQAAAEIKSQEDAAAQKIKALRYLASIGCGGCYPDVEDALIAAMEDCTEAVRYEAVLAVRKTAQTPCCFCSCEACCTEKIQNKLHELALENSFPCCDGEPSARVRRQARVALAECGPIAVSKEPEAQPEGPTEGPTEGPGEGPIDGKEGKEDKTGKQPPADEPLPAPPREAAAPTPSAAAGLHSARESRLAAQRNAFQVIGPGPHRLPPLFSQ